MAAYEALNPVLEAMPRAATCKQQAKTVGRLPRFRLEDPVESFTGRSVLGLRVLTGNVRGDPGGREAQEGLPPAARPAVGAVGLQPLRRGARRDGRDGEGQSCAKEQ